MKYHRITDYNNRMTKARTGYRKESLSRLVHKKTFYLSLLVAIIVVFLLGSLVMLLFERKTNPMIKTYGDAVWLSVVTMTTVGYGDKYPITPGGKVTGMVSMVVGIALVTTAVTAGAAARIDKAKRRRRGLDRESALSNHYLLCGWNSRARYVLDRLIRAEGKERFPIAVLCDAEENPYEHDTVFFYKGNPTSERDLRRVRAADARAVVILADDTAGGNPSDIDARTVLTALAVKSLNRDSKITAEVLEPENTGHLERAGVGEILDINLVAGGLMGQSAVRYGIIDLINSLSERESSSRIYRVPVEADMVGKEFGEIVAKLKVSLDYNVLALRRQGKVQICEQDCLLEQGDFLLIFSATRPPSAVD